MPFSSAIRWFTLSMSSIFMQRHPASRVYRNALLTVGQHCHATASEKSLHVSAMHLLRRFWPIVLLVLAVAVAWGSGLAHWLNWGTLARNQSELAAWVQAHPIAAPALYVLAYAVVVMLSLPEAAVVSVAGGLLFGTVLGGLLAILGSTLGAVLLFVAIRHHLAPAIAARGGRLIDRIRTELARDGFSYLLAIRLVP